MHFTPLFLLSSLVVALPEQSLDFAGKVQLQDKSGLVKRCFCGMTGCDGSCGSSGESSGCGSGGCGSSDCSSSGCGFKAKFGQFVGNFKKGNFVNNVLKGESNRGMN